MLTVHLVSKEDLANYNQIQKSILSPKTELVLGNAENVEDAVKLARDTAVLGRRKEVVALVPCAENSPRTPEHTREWVELADAVTTAIKVRPIG